VALLLNVGAGGVKLLIVVVEFSVSGPVYPGQKLEAAKHAVISFSSVCAVPAVTAYPGAMALQFW
jgi:hypothetical protein